MKYEYAIVIINLSVETNHPVTTLNEWGAKGFRLFSERRFSSGGIIDPDQFLEYTFEKEVP